MHKAVNLTHWCVFRPD